MANIKRCVQCGLLKDEDEFRKYTYSIAKSTEGRYRVCKSCETINQNYRRAAAIVQSCDSTTPRTKVDPPMLLMNRTEALYAVLEMRGLRTPLHNVTTEKQDSIDSLIEFYGASVSTPISVVASMPNTTPDELLEWMVSDIDTWIQNDISPEYLQETVYESLKAKYRPQTGVDRTTFLPIYDDSFKDILNQILKRFDDYEELMSIEEEESND